MESYSYKELIEEYCDDVRYSEKQKSYLLQPYIYEKDLFNLTPFQYGNLIISDMCGNGSNRGSKNATYLLSNYNYIFSFFEWCVNNKKIINYNPFAEVNELSKNNLLLQFANDTKAKVIYKEDLNKIVNLVPSNKETYALIIGLLFDGVKSNNELSSIRVSYIKNNILLLNGRKIILSKFTINALLSYEKCNTYHFDKNNHSDDRAYLRYKDFLFKRTEDTNFNCDEDYYIKNTATNWIGRLLKNIGLSYGDITKSGLLDALRKTFNELNDKEFSHMFICDEKLNSGAARKINKVGNSYGVMERSNNILNYCLIYLLKSKYYL